MQKREYQHFSKKENLSGKIDKKMISTKEILSKYKSIALIGASKDLKKTSTVVMKYLQEYGFKVYPVNPSIKDEKILNEDVYNEVVDIAKDAVKVGAKVLWLQLNISNNKAKEIVEANNIFYIENKCTKIEFEKFLKK